MKASLVPSIGTDATRDADILLSIYKPDIVKTKSETERGKNISSQFHFKCICEVGVFFSNCSRPGLAPFSICQLFAFVLSEGNRFSCHSWCILFPHLLSF